MLKQDHLEIYDLILTVRSPLFIGSGKEFQRLDYIYDYKTSSVFILDQQELYRLLISKNLIDKYEAFVMTKNLNMYQFLKTINLSRLEFNSIIKYKIKSSNFKNNHPIQRFNRNGEEKIYVPGSSVKGALRTVLLQERILNDKKGRNPLLDIKDIKKHESDYLNTLQFKKASKQKQSDAVNSIMRGISVSDSAFIDISNLIIVDKQDVQTDGSIKISRIPVYRECIKPETEIHLKLTLDHSVLKGGITAKTLIKSIEEYDDYYNKIYVQKFIKHENNRKSEVAAINNNNWLILGGGTGFFSKSIAYPYYGEYEAVNKVSNYLSRSFRSHHHQKDKKLKISPRTLKFTQYGSRYYPYGVCGVEIK